MTDTEHINRVVNHWCPETCHHEQFELRLMRAFMHVTACAADQKRKLDGKDPIRPLDSYPNPLTPFET
jgi:hypothetical protein